MFCIYKCTYANCAVPVLYNSVLFPVSSSERSEKPARGDVLSPAKNLMEILMQDINHGFLYTQRSA